MQVVSIVLITAGEHCAADDDTDGYSAADSIGGYPDADDSGIIIFSCRKKKSLVDVLPQTTMLVEYSMAYANVVDLSIAETFLPRIAMKVNSAHSVCITVIYEGGWMKYATQTQL
ncbi:hypothetical protein PoB_000855800 [Plakobranchus ocellatus]|uniref:Uncharacterized protein n=1 Tax=Plakobranchus ocellatus TaxID=259542 RepID=A0AAV3YHR5_9GAST|nr:hypothetical protein PoB_000855800 [Plakobranchus ocellatus]